MLSKTLNLHILLFLSLSFLNQGLFAQKNLSLVLPFRIEGKKLKNHWLTYNAEYKLQDALHFVLKESFRHNILNKNKSQKFLYSIKYNESTSLTKNKANFICQNKALHSLFSGLARRYEGRRLSLQITKYSCRTSKIIKSKVIFVSSRLELQSAFRQALKKYETIFPLQKINYNTNSSNNIDIVAILDFSGSMRVDIPIILRELRFLRDKFSNSSRLGIISLEEKNGVSTLPLSSQWNKNLDILKNKPIRGETRESQFREAIRIVENYKKWENLPFLLFFTDFALSSNFSSYLIPHLHTLRQEQKNFCFFPLLRQSVSSQKLWYKYLQSVNGKYLSNLSYARSAYLAGKGELYFIRRGWHFFLSQQNPKNQLSQNNTPRLDWENIATNLYPNTSLDLNYLPQAYANRKKDKILRFGKYYSNMGHVLMDCLDIFTKENNIAKERILVQGEKKAFWIDVDKESIPIIRKYGKNKFYIGLHWERNNLNPSIPFRNLSSPVYFLSQADVPQLFVWRWEDIQSLALDKKSKFQEKIYKKNIYFLYVKLLKIKNEEEREDIRL